MLSAGRTIRAAWRATLVIAGATFAGIISVSLVEPVVIYALPFSAGVTIYVAATDLIPEVNHEGGVRRSLLIFVGVALFYLTHLMLHAALGECTSRLPETLTMPFTNNAIHRRGAEHTEITQR